MGGVIPPNPHSGEIRKRKQRIKIATKIAANISSPHDTLNNIEIRRIAQHSVYLADEILRLTQ